MSEIFKVKYFGKLPIYRYLTETCSHNLVNIIQCTDAGVRITRRVLPLKTTLLSEMSLRDPRGSDCQSLTLVVTSLSRFKRQEN